MRSAPRTAPLIVLALLIAVSAAAVPAAITTVDTPTCDVLSAPATVDELGPGPTFPVGEQITAAGVLSTFTPCSGVADSALVNNIEVSITNVNVGISFSAVY